MGDLIQKNHFFWSSFFHFHQHVVRISSKKHVKMSSPIEKTMTKNSSKNEKILIFLSWFYYMWHKFDNKKIFSWNIYIWVIWLEMIQNSLKKRKKYRIFRLRFTTFDMISIPKFKGFTKILLMGNLYKNDGKSLKVSFQKKLSKSTL